MQQASPPEKQDMGGKSWWESEDNLVAVRDYAILNGLIWRSSLEEKDDSCVQAPVILLPTLFPTELFHLAQDIQEDLNLMVETVSLDHEFITHVLESVIRTDEFTRNLYEIYSEVYRDNKQTCCLGVHRSDYMVDYTLSSPPAPPADRVEQLCLRQIELNTISVSFAGLNSRLKDFHEYVESRYAPPRPYKYELPDNPCLERVSDAFACAWRAYGKTSAHLLMVVVNLREVTVYDQRMIEFDLWKRYRIPTIRRTLDQLVDDASLGPDRELFVSGMEVAVVYYRSGYSPDHYPTAKVWGARRVMELSRASLCPSVAYQLVGTKKMQQVLAEPGVLERFVKDPAAVSNIRSTFAGLYSLEMTPSGDKAVEMALKDPERFVMKPQREGGGNNYYGKDVQSLLQRIGSTKERESYILMDRIRPRTQDALILTKHMFQTSPTPTVGELGVYGGFVRCRDEVLYNSEAGYMLKTKRADVNEGYVIVGLGSGALDTPSLVSGHEYIRLTTPAARD